jgi:hypothetical protein
MENSIDEIDQLILETFQDDIGTKISFTSMKQMSLYTFDMLRSHPYMKEKSNTDIYTTVREWMTSRMKCSYSIDKEFLLKTYNKHLSELVMRIDLRQKKKEKSKHEVVVLMKTKLLFLLNAVFLNVKVPRYLEMTVHHYIRFCISNEHFKNKKEIIKMLDLYIYMEDFTMLRFLIDFNLKSSFDDLKNEVFLDCFASHLYENIYVSLLSRRLLTGDNGFYEIDFMSKLPLPPLTFFQDEEFFKSEIDIDEMNSFMDIDDMLSVYMEK